MRQFTRHEYIPGDPGVSVSPEETFQRHLCSGAFAGIDRSSPSKVFPWKYPPSYESLASQGCKHVLSCHGTIVTCAMGWCSFIHRSYFLPKSVFRFIFIGVVSPLFRKQKDPWRKEAHRDLVRYLNEFFCSSAINEYSPVKMLLGGLRYVEAANYYFN